LTPTIGRSALVVVNSFPSVVATPAGPMIAGGGAAPSGLIWRDRSHDGSFS